MRFQESYHLPVPADLAAQRLADPATFAESARRLQARSHEETVTPTGEGFLMEATMTVPTAGFPPQAAKFVGEHLPISYRQQWSGADPAGARSCDMTIALPGLPLGCTGTLALTPASEGASTITVDADVKAQIPFMGAKLEQAATPAMHDAVTTIVGVVAEGAPQA